MSATPRNDPRVMVAEARAALARGERGPALALLARAVEEFPRLAALQVEFGNLAFAHGDRVAAEAAYLRALDADPGDFAALIGLGNALRERGETQEAIARYRQAAVLAPTVFACWYNLGLALREVGLYDEAIEAYDRALAIDTGKAAGWYNRGNALTGAARFADAVSSYDKALRLSPDYADALYSKSMALLLDGELAEGWDLYEARWRSRLSTSGPRFRCVPQWTGEPLAGRRLLVWGEQGIGDEARFLSVLAEVATQAGAVLYAGERRLRTLIARSFPGVTLAEPDMPDEDIAARADVQSPVGSLARFRRRSFADFPAPPRPFLVPDEARRQRWGEWLAGLGPRHRPRIGISWRTGRDARRKQARYASLDEWGRFLASVPAEFVCLQYDTCDDDLACFRDRSGVDVRVPPGLDRRDDFEAMAGLYAALDAVVSAPNTVADFAGALGVPCWVVVHAPHWPWAIWPQAGAGRQPWYAGLTMIDARDGGWDAAFGRVRAALEAHFAD